MPTNFTIDSWTATPGTVIQWADFLYSPDTYSCGDLSYDLPD
jgi:hypothetical protein